MAQQHEDLSQALTEAKKKRKMISLWQPRYHFLRLKRSSFHWNKTICAVHSLRENLKNCLKLKNFLKLPEFFADVS